jgi:hypothetical protein
LPVRVLSRLFRRLFLERLTAAYQAGRLECQAVRSLAKHYNRSPELLAEEEVRRYLLDVRERNARGYWKPKLEGNLARDRRHYHELQALGYSVFVVWECETRNPELLNSVVLRLRDQIPRRGQNRQPPC